MPDPVVLGFHSIGGYRVNSSLPGSQKIASLPPNPNIKHNNKGLQSTLNVFHKMKSLFFFLVLGYIIIEIVVTSLLKSLTHG